ncbi:MAG: hypothetical protein H6Q21_405 [Bacteroidetes bacterium]|nr:hypothetical protein [Bacteroidota bacterium]
MKMLLYFILLPLFLLHSSGTFAQDTHYYQGISQEAFRKDKSFNDTLDFCTVDLPRLNALVFYMTNEIRAKHKLPALEYAKELEDAASMHSRDMVMKDFFSHENPFDKKKKTPNDRALLTGVQNPYIAENIAEDFGLQYKSGSNVYVLGKGKFSYEPEEKRIPPKTYLMLAGSLLERWMNSPEHRKNILSPDALQMGCGTYFFTDSQFNDMPTFMATQNFQWYEKIERLKENK